MSNTTPIISLKNISASYGKNSVLENINLQIPSKDFLGIIGPNGSGKTTLLKIILGLMEPTRGSVEIFGKPPKENRKKIGYVPQHTHFDKDFPIKVWEVVLMGRMSHRGLFKNYTKEDKQFAGEALKNVGMSESGNCQIGSLSQGQKQRVFIARALATQAEILLLDEPTASVDSPMQTNLYELLGKLSKQMTIVLVSHDLGVISSFVKTLACLNKKLYYHGTSNVTQEDLEKTYQCPIEIIGHGHVPHRVLKDHEHD